MFGFEGGGGGFAVDAGDEGGGGEVVLGVACGGGFQRWGLVVSGCKEAVEDGGGELAATEESDGEREGESGNAGHLAESDFVQRCGV